MLVRFWGTRGSIATPGPQTAKYGGNTSCVEVRAGEGTVIVLDCGTGARELGLQLIKSGVRPLHINLFIGHIHWDHIQGFPFFVPVFLPDTELNIYAPAGFKRSLEEALAGQMQYSYFPVKLQDLRGHLRFTDLEEGFFRVGNVLVETQYLNHTAPTIAYRISADGATVAYVTDHEPFRKPTGPNFRHPGDQSHVTFLKGADLIIHDAQYSEEEYPSKIGWGHSTTHYAADVAIEAGVSRLALFHHDPMHDDTTMERLEEDARAHVAARGAGLDVFAAKEGQELEVRGSGKAQVVTVASALSRRPIAGGRVMVVSADEKEISTIREELGEDGLLVVPMQDQRTALAQALEISPDMAIINRNLPDSDGEKLVRALRDRLGRQNVPILLLTDSANTEPDLASNDLSVTDYLATPFSPPMLRTRVRAWLARSLMEKRTEPSTLLDRTARGMDRRTPSGRPGKGRATSTAQHASMLASVPLFRSLNRKQLHRLANRATEQLYSAGQVVIRQGQVADRIFVVLSGRVRVVEAAADLPQVELFLGELGHGEIFGEMAVLNDRLRSATVMAIEPSRCLVLPGTSFLSVLKGAPELMMSLLQVMTARLHNADRLLARYAPDPLTGLSTRRAFHDQYERVVAEARRCACGLALLFLDITDLKSINDRFGYSVGDEVIRAVAGSLIDASRPTDLIARYGGDEFTVLMLDAGEEEADSVKQRLKEGLAELASRHGLTLTIRCGIGWVVSHDPPATPEELLREADRNLQQSKAQETSQG